ncbi:MAG TPA: tRNA glutamyl-Q(34) synthetase GluQRS [Caulobacteraceae bacterium]|jgi:glutamyl-Q tRNA(Asp) synthetase
MRGEENCTGEDSIVITRFAPSPTGLLHRGHAFSAMTAFDAAQAAGGRLLLRIEDIDTARCRPEFEAAIFEDLAWLGLTWDEPVVVQSRRLGRYAAALARLAEAGLLYRCFKTRTEVAQAIGRAPHGAEPAFFGEPLGEAEEAKRVAAGEPFAWRLSIRAAERALGGFAGLTFSEEGEGVIIADPWRAGDVILARKDLGVAYHLAAVVDDGESGVTQVIRGQDLKDACHVQRLLQALLGLPAPTYRHHRLILRADGRRLAKRDTAETLRGLRSAGVAPAALRAQFEL